VVGATWSTTEFKSDSLFCVVDTLDIDWPSSGLICYPDKFTCAVVEDPVTLGLLGDEVELCRKFIDRHWDAGIIRVRLVI
jgi:hypothetical protein